MTVAIVRLGAGNTASVQFALERLGTQALITSDPAEIAQAERLILPGVGAAPYAMDRLRELALVDVIRAFPRPLIGLCLGQQLLFERSDEGEGADLLSLIPGTVRRLEPGQGRPVPHMGWSRLRRLADDPLLDGIQDGDHAYFVHSYVCPTGPATLAEADYGETVPAVVRAGNRWGCQFHPERSSDTGRRILANFLEIAA